MGCVAYYARRTVGQEATDEAMNRDPNLRVLHLLRFRLEREEKLLLELT